MPDRISEKTYTDPQLTRRTPRLIQIKYMKRGKGGQGQNRTADTRIFSPAMVPGLSVTIGRQLNESKRLELVLGGLKYRLGPIRADGSGKVVTKWSHRSGRQGIHDMFYVCPPITLLALA